MKATAAPPARRRSAAGEPGSSSLQAGGPAPAVHHVTNRPGRALDAGLRATMESRLGGAFGDVRVHTDAQASASAAAVGARACTLGTDIVFGAGRYRPDSAAGQSLVAHELTHVLQQRGTASGRRRRNDRGRLEHARAGGRPVRGGCAGGFAPFRPAVTCRADRAARVCRRDLGVRLRRLQRPGLPGGSARHRGPGQSRGWTRHAVRAEGAEQRGRRACDRHDECYQTCALAAPVARRACNQRMFLDMMATCNASSEPEDVRAACLDWAACTTRACRWAVTWRGTNARRRCAGVSCVADTRPRRLQLQHEAAPPGTRRPRSRDPRRFAASRGAWPPSRTRRNGSMIVHRGRRPRRGSS